MKNLELKEKLLWNGMYETYCKLRYAFKESKLYERMLDCNSYGLTEIEYKSCEQLRNSNYKARKRMDKKINSWKTKGYNVYWLTLKFNNKYLNLSSRTRKEHVFALINDTSVIDYIGTIDYGKITNKEHYHFLFATKEPLDIKKNQTNTDWLNEYSKVIGDYWITKASLDKDSMGKLEYYIAKKKLLQIEYGIKISNFIYKRFRYWKGCEMSTI